MRIGMAVNVPRTEEARENIRKLISLVDEAAVCAEKAELYVIGHPGSEFFKGLSEQLSNTRKEIDPHSSNSL